MDKLLLIIKREYLSRVTRRSFILATLLTPLAFALFFAIVSLIFSYQSDDVKRVAVIDEAGLLKGAIKDEQHLFFKFEKGPLDSLRANFKQLDFDGILLIPQLEDILDRNFTVFYYANDQPTPDIEALIEQRVTEAVRDYKIEALQLERKQLEALNTRVQLEPEPINPQASDATRLTSAIAAGMGGLMGFVMYLTVFIYGMMVLRSVMEEKTNRIVEVMMSSVRPFQLMLGKIIGVGAVGLTQVAVWTIMIPTLAILVQLLFGIDPSSMNLNQPGVEVNPDDVQAMTALALQEINNLNWWLILPLFFVFFLGGYFLYASLFAAVGSAIGDDMGESQSLTLPITIPVILALYIMMVAVQAPNSSLARWSSIFPLFSPIVMPARLAFNPPWWEIALSVILLVLTSLFFVWLSGRIYRVGILLYGKKAGFKELAKWVFSRD
ncbi:MAG: ABC transporter permease [Lewinellaceae bacterium]|nr:ABC transporter permease [Lewinellaceae bacterium]